MLKLVHGVAGDVIYINPARISKATRTNDITHIFFDNGDTAAIRETIAEVFHDV